ncbi:MAG: hypothetical protein JNK22_09515 [Rhodocyclaceae bacterium]|nr:hypothetical protein [Rhodocyclaceae bacterium]
MSCVPDYGFELGVEGAWPAGWDPGRSAPGPAAPAPQEARVLVRLLLARLAGDGLGRAALLPPVIAP